MQLHRFPSYAVALKNRRLRVAGFFAALSACLGLIGLVWHEYRFWFWLAMLFPVPEAISLLKRALQAAQGSDGEDRVIETLKGLDDRYTLVTNWVPEEGKGDVDLLLLGPHGVLVMEVKTYVVDVKCEGDKWSIRNERGGWRPVKSFSRQLAGNMKRTSKALGVKATGVLVFNDRASLEIANCPALILRRKELLNRVHSLPETESEIDRLRTLIPELLAAA